MINPTDPGPNPSHKNKQITINATRRAEDGAGTTPREHVDLTKAR